MSLELFLYLANLADNISIFLAIVFVSFSVISLAYFIASKPKVGSLLLGVGLLSLLISVPIPSSRTLYLIAGVHYLKTVELPTKVAQILEDINGQGKEIIK